MSKAKRFFFDTLLTVCQHGARMGGSQNQFSLTRAASINRRDLKKKFPVSIRLEPLPQGGVDFHAQQGGIIGPPAAGSACGWTRQPVLTNRERSAMNCITRAALATLLLIPSLAAAQQRLVVVPRTRLGNNLEAQSRLREEDSE